MLAFSPMSAALLRDADIGWHIRSGELILVTHAIPRTDPFSYTRQGEPWCAWEWLYDVVIAAIHHVSGLNGVVLFTAVVIGSTFALLFRFVLRRSGNLVVAGGLTLLAIAAAQVHMLARPHVLSWLLTLLWVENLCRFEEGKRSALLWLPPLMLLWANLHAGFILGLGLLGVFAIGCVWSARTAPREGDRQKIIQLGSILAVCLLATLLTPYGYRLHVHVYQYLSDSFLMNNIEEFASPNFHLPVYGYFEVLIVLVIAGAALARDQLRPTGLLLLLFSLSRRAICSSQYTYCSNHHEPGSGAVVDRSHLSSIRFPAALVRFDARYGTRHLGEYDVPGKAASWACAGVGCDGRIHGAGFERWAACFQDRWLPPILMRRPFP